MYTVSVHKIWDHSTSMEVCELPENQLLGFTISWSSQLLSIPLSLLNSLKFSGVGTDIPTPPDPRLGIKFVLNGWNDLNTGKC